MRNTIVVISLCAVLCGCGARAQLKAEADPAFTPRKSDPVILFLSDTSSIHERKLVPVLKHQLAANGFNVVDDVEGAQWVLAMTYGDETIETGSTSRGFSGPVGGLVYGKSKTTIDYQKDGLLHLYLFATSDFKSGRRQAVWEGDAVAEGDVIDEHSAIIIDDLLQVYGANYDDDRMMRFQNAR